MRVFSCENCAALITSDLALPLWYSSALSVIEDAEICPFVVYSAPGDVSLFFVDCESHQKGADSGREGLRSSQELRISYTTRINYGTETP